MEEKISSRSRVVGIFVATVGFLASTIGVLQFTQTQVRKSADLEYRLPRQFYDGVSDEYSEHFQEREVGKLMSLLACETLR
ncbi:hypothetical protein ABID21_005025 [Pseudorhizobium tarimense]|uniref:Uncharacterized protein n=1 Tax=Pseudorhizobium tarimense TaxID=1079109 RepID=A0ABV2HEB6_9HYPH